MINILFLLAITVSALSLYLLRDAYRTRKSAIEAFNTALKRMDEASKHLLEAKKHLDNCKRLSKYAEVQWGEVSHDIH